MTAARQVTEWSRPIADSVKLNLPLPPSVNALWRKGRSGMYRSPSYMTWINAAGTILNAQRPGRIEGDYVLVAKLERKNSRADLDNKIKALSDLLETHGVIENDCRAQSITLMWSPAVEGCQVVLTPVYPDPSASKTVREA